MNWTAAVWSGVIAGIVATAVQLALWSAGPDVLPEILYRDARLTAAIVLGRSVLPPPATLAWGVMAVATLIHFALSIIYSMILAGFIARLAVLPALLVGTGYGVALYVINLYGFTVIFPWFAASRDGITLLSHAVLGVIMAGAYKLWTRQRLD
ncbi:MAG: sodium:proline symporter [Gammaproteobacteria bacterium]|nr:sodium:proline symporter [Gammaproteobacteria bacterium]